jgi:hemerythrin
MELIQLHAPRVGHFNDHDGLVRQREQIADDLDRLAESLDESHEKEPSIDALDDLMTHTRAHFQNQESEWNSATGLHRGWHRDAHSFVLEYLQRMRDDTERLDRQQLLLRLAFIRHWLTSHFRSEDSESI